MQNIIKSLQLDQTNLKSQVDLLLTDQQNSSKRISSPANFYSVTSPTSEVGAVILPTTASLLASANSKQSLGF